MVECLEISVEAANMVRNIFHAFPELSKEFLEKPASPNHLIDLVEKVLNILWELDPCGWAVISCGDLYPEDGWICDDKPNMQMLRELVCGLSVGTYSADLCNIGFDEHYSSQVVALCLAKWNISSMESDNECVDREGWFERACSIAKSHAGLLFETEDWKYVPEYSKHWQAILHVDGGSSNNLVSLRSGYVSVEWEMLEHLAEEIRESVSYTKAFFEFDGMLDGKDPYCGLIDWACKMRRALEEAAREEEGKSAGSKSY